MVQENIKQTTVCKSYAKSHEKFDENKAFKLVSTNSILSARPKALQGLMAFNLSQPRRYFNILNLFKPGEILDSLIYSKESI